MIAKEDILELLNSTESYRVERTVSTGNMDKFCEAICAFSNDMPGSRKNGYLIIGAKDDGSIAGMKVDDALLKKIAGIRSDGNILPLPTMSVERFSFPEGDLLVAEVKPSDLPPVRYRGRVFIRVLASTPSWKIWILITSRPNISRWFSMRRRLQPTSATLRSSLRQYISMTATTTARLMPA